MLGATPSFTQMSTGGANPQGILEDISTRSLKTVRIGELAGKLATGTGNVFTGYGAAAAGASINNSVLVGFESGRFASSLSSATFVGAFTGARADRSHETTLVGYAAGELMKDCTQCVGVGAYTLREATALQTTAVGCRALERSLDADYNVGVGAECMQNNRSGSFNTAVGFQAMRAAFTSSECVMIGAYAGYSNALGTGITAVGYRSCEFMEDGAYSVAVGAYSLQNSSFTSNTVAIGPFAGKTAAAENAVLIGTNVASDATSIVGSVIVGESAGSHHEGSNTVIIGARTARNVQGDDSVIIGADALTGGGLDIIANSTIAIGSNVAPSLRSSENSVLIGPGADSFRSSLTLGIAIGTVETTTNDKSISIGGNIENARISSVLIGNQLSSDADNSVLLGKGITVSSVIFFKNPLVFPYVKAVARDAYNKIGASNINYTNILKSPDGIDTYLVASAGYLTTPIANSSSIFMDLLPNPITSYDLRTHAPNLNYALVNGATFLITNTPANPSASNIWATTSDSSLSAFTLGLSSSSITTFADAYQEDHSFTITQLPTTTTVNITNFDKSSIVVPVFAPKRAIYAKATSEQAQVPIPITSINTPMTLSPSFSNPSASFAIEQIMPTNISKCNIVFEPVLQPTYGMLSNVASRFPTYTMPIESVFATTDAFQVRPVQVMKETYTETQHSLKHFDASNIYSVSVSDSRLFLPNALPASNIINLSTNVITYGPVPTSVPSGEQLCVRLTEIPQASQWVTAENTVYSSNDVLTMITSNIDAYPDAQNATYFATAKTAIDTAVQNIKPVLAQPQLSTQFDSLLANLKTLSNYMPVNVVPNYQTAYTSATQNTQNIINWGVGSSTYDSLWASLNTQSQYIISNIRQERAEVNTINSLLTSLTSPIQTSKLAIESFVSTSTPLFNTLNTNLQTLSTYIGSSQTANYNAALARISQESSKILSNGTETTNYNTRWASIQSDKDFILSIIILPDPPQLATIQSTLLQINTTVGTAKTNIQSFTTSATPILNNLIADANSLSNVILQPSKPAYNSAIDRITQYSTRLLNDGKETTNYTVLKDAIATDAQLIISYITMPDPPEVAIIHTSLSNIEASASTFRAAANTFTTSIAPLFSSLITDLRTLSNITPTTHATAYTTALNAVIQDTSAVQNGGINTTQIDALITSIQNNTQIILSNVVLPVLEPPEIARIAVTLSNIDGAVAAYKQEVTSIGTTETLQEAADSFSTNITPLFSSLITDLQTLSNITPSSNESAYTTALTAVLQDTSSVINGGINTTQLDTLIANIQSNTQIILSNVEPQAIEPPEIARVAITLNDIDSAVATYKQQKTALQAAANSFTTTINPLFSSLITDLQTLSNITPTTHASAYSTALAAVISDTSAVSNGGIDTTQMDTLITNIHSNTQIILSNVVFPVLEPLEIARISITLNSVNTSIASFKTQITTYLQVVNPLFINLSSKLTSLSTYIPTLNQASYTALMNTVQLRITAFKNWNLASFDSVSMFESLSSSSQAIINLVYIPNPQAATDITSALSQLSSYVSTALANAQTYVSTVTSLLNTLISNVTALSPIILANKVTEYNEAVAFINDDKVQLLNKNIGLTNYDSIYSSLVSQTNFILSIYRVPDPSQVGIISTTSTSIASQIATALTKMDTYITTATPLFTQLRTNLVSLSDVIPTDKTTLYNTAITAVTQDTTSILNRNIGSTNYDPLFNTIKTNSQYVTSIIRIPDPVQVAAINTILSNANTAIFATYGIAPIGNNLVLLYNAVRTTPPSIASTSRTFFSQSPTNTHGKTAAAAYDLWWTKYTIPRAFIALPTPLQPSSYLQAVSPSTVIENTSIKIKIPDVLTSSVTTTSVSDSLTIRVNAAQPLIHPNWDLSSNMTHDVSQNKQLFALDVATMSILIPPQYGTLIKATTSPTLSLSNYEYTPSHPFYTDDTTLLVTNTFGSSQVINVGFTRPNISPIYTQTIHAPWKASTETKTWGKYTSNIVSQNITTLSNLQIYNGSETNEISPDVGTIIYPTQSNYFPTTYNPTIGLSTYTSNVTKSRIITKQQNYNNFQNQNQLNVTFTYTYSNIVYGFNNNILSTNKIVSPSTQFTIYTPLEPPNVNEQKYTIDSNELLLVREYRKQSFDSYTDSVIGETLAFSVSNWFDGNAPTYLYSCNIYTESPNITTVTYQVETPIGSSVASQLERNLISTSNIIQTIPTAAVRPHQLATSGPSSSIFSANADLYKTGIGKVNQFTALDVLNNTIFVPVSSVANDYIITANNATATLSVKGYSIGSSVKVIDTTQYEFILDPTIYKVSLASLLSSSSTYVLQADDGYIDGQTFIPNSPLYGSERTLTYFTANTTQVVGNIRTLKYTVLSRHHPNGQALNTGVAFIQTRLLSPRIFTPPTAVVTFKGFSSAGWTLKNNATQATAVTGTSISISDVQVNRWTIHPPTGVVANGTTVQLTYSNDLSSVVNSYPVKTYNKDDFPFVQAANDSIWQVRRIGPSPALPVSQLIGALWSEINRVGLAQSDVFIELMEPLIHAFLYDSREPNRQQWRFTLASMYGGYITVIPKTPNAFRNESVKLRILYDGRPSPIYTIQFQPLWSIFSEITTTEISVTSVPTADIPLSPSLVELGYKWELTEGNALRLASTQVNLLSIGPYSRTQMYIPKAPVQSPSILANSVITITIDQADRNIFDYSTIYPYISYNASVPLIFYLTKRPLNGIVTINGESATRWLPTNGSFVYQHNGSLTFTDTFELSVASNPFDVSATMLTINITIQAIPYVTILKQDKLFASDLSELSILRTFEKTADAETLFQVISTNGYLHVTASNYLIPTSNTYSISANTTAPIKYTINPLIALSENPPISVTFTVNASSTYHVNPLVAYPAYASLFAYTMSATLNHHTSINAFQDREQPSQNQGFVYSIDSKDIGAKNLVDRSVGIYLEYQPNYLINYSSNALAFNQISRIKSCRYVFEGLTSGDDGPLFRFDVTHKATTASVQFTMKDQVYNLSNIDIDTPTDVYNSLYFVSNEENDDGSRSVAFYLGFSFENTQNVNANRNVLSLLKVPPIKLDTMTSLQFRYDLQDSANFIGSSNIVIPSGPLKVSYSLSNYATTLLLRNFQVLINTNTLSEINGGEELYDPYKYNVVIGNALAVRGVDNICIGSTFTTSGQNSIILGNNIGVANNEQINEIYESIVIGSESFANAFVRDVIAIGKNIYNDLIDVELERVADFLSFKPIMIGNDITKNMLDFHVNVGNVFLCTAQISKQIYLGIGNEAIGIGYTSNQGFTSAALNVNGATATTSITLAAGSGTLGYHGYSYTGQLGDIVRYGANNILSATTLRNDTLTLGVWSGSDTVSQLVTTGRSRIYVTGVVAAGDLLASYGPGAPEGTAMAQTGTMAQARMSYTVAKALETVNVALGSRVLIDCFVLSG